MSIASEITRLQTAKNDIKTQLEAKGVSVSSSATLSDFAGYVSGITTGTNKLPSIMNGTVREITASDLTGATQVKPYLFNECFQLTAATIPNSVTKISNYAFKQCTQLANLVLPDSVTTIGEYAFGDCTSLTSLTLPQALTTIGIGAFNGCKMETISIPSGVTTIGTSAFKYNNTCTGITVNAVNPPTLGQGAFDNTNDCPIYVPAESLSTYQTSWSTYSARIQSITT